MATLLEKAAKLGANIGRRKLGSGYAVYRVICTACPWLGTFNNQAGSNYNINNIQPAMNEHARKHIDADENGETLQPPSWWKPPIPQLKRTCMARYYQVEITNEQYLAIEAYDRFEMTRDSSRRTGLAAELDALPGVIADYNGHFGAFVFLQIDVEEDTARRWSDIERLIHRAGSYEIPSERSAGG